RRDRHGAPALHADPRDDGGREHRPRPGADAGRGAARRGRGPAPRARALRPLRPRRRSRRAHPGHHRRPAAARGDPQSPLSRCGDPRPRRAERRAHAAGGAGAVRDHPRVEGRAEVDHLHLAQIARGPRGRRPDQRSSPRPEDRDRPEGGCDRGEPRPYDGRPRGPAPRREATRDTRGDAARSRGPARSRRPQPGEGAGRLVPRAGAGDRRDRGRRRQRPDRADRRPHRPAPLRERLDPGRRQALRARHSARDARRRGRAHPRGPPPPRPRPRVLDRREHRDSRLLLSARLAVRLALSAPPGRARRPADPRLRRPRRRPAHARGRPLRREPAEGGRRPRGRPEPEGADRRPAHSWARRRRDRVRPSPAGRRARRGPGRAARLARARRDPLALRPDPGHVRGRGRRRVRARHLGGGAGHRDVGRPPEGGGRGVSDDKPTGEERFDEEARIEAEEEALEQETPEAVGGGDYAPSVAARVSAFQRAGGAVIPIVTTIFALLMGMVVVAATGHNPLTAFKGIFDGTGLNWLFPWVQGQARTDAAFNLQQTLIVTSTLILAGFAVSFAFKCGMFNIGGNGQYIMGALVSVWIASSWVDMNGSLHIFLAITLATVVGALWAGIAGFLKATVGVHEVISTIMLNFIASYFAQGLVGRGGQLQNTVDTSNPVSSDIAPKTHLPVFWGDPILQGLHVGFFIALGAPIVFW